jgi:hypothetical protein
MCQACTLRRLWIMRGEAVLIILMYILPFIYALDGWLAAIASNAKASKVLVSMIMMHVSFPNQPPCALPAAGAGPEACIHPGLSCHVLPCLS